MSGNVEVEHLPPVVSQDEEYIENEERNGRYREEVNRKQVPCCDFRETCARSARVALDAGPCTWRGIVKLRPGLAD